MFIGNLVVHCAVLSKPGPDSARLFEHPIKAVPSPFDVSEAGHMSLQLALSLRRYALAKVLIVTGADQTCRYIHGDDLVHSMLYPIDGPVNLESKNIHESLSLVGPRLLASILTERSTHRPGSTTLLSCWLYATNSNGTELRRSQICTISDAPEKKEVLDMTFEFCNRADPTRIEGQEIRLCMLLSNAAFPRSSI